MASEDLVRQIVEKHVWDSLGTVKHVPYGYKTRPKVSQKVRDILEFFSVEDDLTARYIRHTPSAFVVQQNPKFLYLVDYKCMTVPVYDDWIIEKVSQKAGRYVESNDIGEIHTTSYNNYMALKDLDVKVAILTYIDYHDRLLLCDSIEKIEALDPYEDENAQTDSNGVRFVNFDVTQMRTLGDFLIEVHKINPDYITPRIQAACHELKENISVDHDSESPLAW